MKTEDDLRKELKENRNMFDEKTFNYFSSLINLEISAVNQKYFTEENLKLYRNFDIYNKIVNFNIPERTLKIVGDVDTKYDDLKLEVSEDRNEFNINFDRGQRLPIIGYKYNKDNNEIILKDFFFNHELHKQKLQEIDYFTRRFSDFWDYTCPSDIIVTSGSHYAPFFEEDEKYEDKVMKARYFYKLYDKIAFEVIDEDTIDIDEKTNEVIKDIRSKILNDYGMEELNVKYFTNTDLHVPIDRNELLRHPSTSLEPYDELYEKNNPVVKVKRIIHIP